ncbi:MAG: hypothetical protein NZ874_01965 [Fimbriimonadales bacterium]|nr:hypothetical protein [Fimbriimonadales bacterium]
MQAKPNSVSYGSRRRAFVASASRRRPRVARAFSPRSVARTVVSVRGGLDTIVHATGAWARRPSHETLASAGRRRYAVRLLEQS